MTARAQQRLKQQAADMGWKEEISFESIKKEMRREAIEHMTVVRLANLKRRTFNAFASYIFQKLRAAEEALEKAFSHYALKWMGNVFRQWRHIARFERVLLFQF